ncbi:hypothetical protein DRP53_00155 [candidate division WOR-3 bacterium]|uniref:Leucine-binding protein domain-containing protein n=1 Tax=candidate division WOR-3 bacterium TaxID=2052148 RepID=A0A660SM39_UNCW3|nr:MAG: hypothetical protein DRP53_00155 [candidate division WOR-3 bacterium]
MNMRLLIIPIILSTTCVERPIKIGVVADLSGSGRDLGWSIVRGVELAVDEYNEHAIAPKILLLVRDDRGDSARAVAMARDLTKRGVIGVIGHMNSHCSIAAAPIYHKSRIPMITPSSTAPELTQLGYDNVFRLCGRDDLQGKIAGYFVKEHLKSKRILILADRSIYAQGLANAFESEMENRVVGRVDFETGHPPLEKLKAMLPLKLPDLVYFAGLYKDGAEILRLIPKKIDFLAGDGIATQEFLKLTGGRAEGVYFTFGPPIHQLGSAVHFLRIAHEKRIQVEPYTCNAYDATNLLIDAYFRAKGKDLSSFIHHNKFDGSIGMIQFDKNGDLLGSPFMIWMVKGGGFIPWSKKID